MGQLIKHRGSIALPLWKRCDFREGLQNEWRFDYKDEFTISGSTALTISTSSGCRNPTRLRTSSSWPRSTDWLISPKMLYKVYSFLYINSIFEWLILTREVSTPSDVQPKQNRIIEEKVEAPKPDAQSAQLLNQLSGMLGKNAFSGISKNRKCKVTRPNPGTGPHQRLLESCSQWSSG